MTPGAGIHLDDKPTGGGACDRPLGRRSSVYRSTTGWFTVTAYSEIPSPGGIVIPAFRVADELPR